MMLLPCRHSIQIQWWRLALAPFSISFITTLLVTRTDQDQFFQTVGNQRSVPGFRSAVRRASPLRGLQTQPNHFRAASKCARLPLHQAAEAQLDARSDARRSWWQAIGGALRYVLVLFGALAAWICGPFAALRRGPRFRMLRQVPGQPRIYVMQMPAKGAGRPQSSYTMTAATEPKGMEWVLRNDAAGLHLPREPAVDLRALMLLQEEQLQQQAEQRKVMSLAAKELTDAIGRVHRAEEREQATLREHVDVLQEDRRRMQDELLTAREEVAKREAALALLRDAEVEVIRLQASLRTSRQTALAWMGLLLLAGVFAGFLLGTTLGLLAVGLAALLLVMALAFVRRGPGAPSVLTGLFLTETVAHDPDP